MKRSRSDLELSPNTAAANKSSGLVFSYEETPPLKTSGIAAGCTTATGGKSSTGANTTTRRTKLPRPAEFGCGNPFLLFMCVTLIVQQKHKIIGSQMDMTDVSGYFYRLVRSHDVHKVLTHARMLFADYLRKQPWLDDDNNSEC